MAVARINLKASSGAEGDVSELGEQRAAESFLNRCGELGIATDGIDEVLCVGVLESRVCAIGEVGFFRSVAADGFDEFVVEC